MNHVTSNGGARDYTDGLFSLGAQPLTWKDTCLADSVLQRPGESAAAWSSNVDLSATLTHTMFIAPHHGRRALPTSYVDFIDNAIDAVGGAESGWRAIDLGLAPLSAKQLARVESATTAWLQPPPDVDFVVECKGEPNWGFSLYLTTEEPVQAPGWVTPDLVLNAGWVNMSVASDPFTYQPAVVNDPMATPWFRNCYDWLIRARARGLSALEIRAAVSRRRKALQTRRPRANRRLVRWTLPPLRRLQYTLSPHAPPTRRRPDIVAEGTPG